MPFFRWPRRDRQRNALPRKLSRESATARARYPGSAWSRERQTAPRSAPRKQRTIRRAESPTLKVKRSMRFMDVQSPAAGETHRDLGGADHFGSDSPGSRDRKMRCSHRTRGTVHQRSRARQTRPPESPAVLSLFLARVSELSPTKVRLARLKEVPKMAARNRHESLTWGMLILILGVLLQIHYLRPELEILHNLWKF